METPAQKIIPPRTDELEAFECGTGRRQVIGEIFYSARYTRPDESLPSRRVAKYVDKWCEWAETELEHLVGYVANTTDYCLVFINEGDTWDDLSVEFWADSNFVAPKSTSGEYLELGGPQGSQYPMDWDARLQAVQTTSSGEAEAVSWGSATKGAIKLAAMVEYTRAKPVEIIGLIDSQAVEQAINKGYSQKLGHLRKHAEVSLRLLHESGVKPRHTPGTENIADAFTKALGRVKLQYLLGRLFGLPVVRLDNGSVRVRSRAQTAKELDADGLTTQSGSGTCRSPFAQLARSDEYRMAPGTRLVTQHARAQLLDNADGLAHTANAYDSARPSQADRHKTLVDWERQQLDKAAALKDKLEEDAKHQREGASIAGSVGKARFTADLNVTGGWIASKKHRDRLRVAPFQKRQIAAERALTFPVSVVVTSLSAQRLNLGPFSADASLVDLRDAIREAWGILLLQQKRTFS